MKKMNYDEVMAKEVGKGCKGVTIRWLITKEMGAENFAMRMFEVEPEGHTPLHSHEWEHEVFVLEGEGLVMAQNGEEMLKPGDVIFMPSMEKHQFKNTGPGNLKFLCLIPIHE
ncbi:MAG: cupin domain-containing protein [Methanomassiliicoccales archaeon]|nr:MAG: cupin domain-containing protein [Methanomassiliicoccales archaeon]